MNIAYIVSYDPFDTASSGGGSINTGIIATQMQKRGHDVSIFYTGSQKEVNAKRDLIRLYAAKGTRIPIVGGIEANINLLPIVNEQVKISHYDVLEIRGTGAGLPFIRNAKLVSAPVYHLMDVYKNEFSGLPIFHKVKDFAYYAPNIALERLIIMLSKWFIVDTVSVGRDLVALNKRTKDHLTVIPPALSFHYLHYKPQDFDPTLFFFIGARNRRNTELFLRALKYANDHGVPATGLVLRENIDRYATLAQELGVSVKFQNRIQDSELVKNYAKSCAYVLPSYREAICMPVIEAASQNTPSIVSNLPSVMEFVKDGQNGIVVQDMRPDHWGQALMRIATDEYERKILGANARNDALKYFPDEIGARTERLYSSLLN